MEQVFNNGTSPKGSFGVWLLAWPSIITNLLYASSSIIAIKVVGSFGSDEIAAAITGQRITFIMQAVLSGILAGTAALVARNWGANKHDEAGKYITTTIQLVLILSVLCVSNQFNISEDDDFKFLISSTFIFLSLKFSSNCVFI